jgi:hypothetical protein
MRITAVSTADQVNSVRRFMIVLFQARAAGRAVGAGVITLTSTR